jgi:hypothetical protein
MQNISPLLDNSDTRLRGSAWLVFLLVATTGLSMAFSCATPFAALAALSALTLKRSHAVLFMLSAWVINQSVGFGFLHYPHDASTIQWGAAIGLSAIAAVATASLAASMVGKTLPAALSYATTLIAAFIGFQLVILAANLMMLGNLDAFDVESKSQVALIDMVAFAGLAAAQRAAEWAGVFSKSTAAQTA